MSDKLNRYRALLRSQTDERVCRTLREMIHEIEEREERIAAEHREPPEPRARDR